MAVVYGSKVVAKRKPEKNSGGIGIDDLGDIGAVLYKLSYQANWELVIFCVGNTYIHCLNGG